MIRYFNDWLADVNPSPGNGFLRRLPATGVCEMVPKHISSSKADSDKIPAPTPMFSGQAF